MSWVPVYITGGGTQLMVRPSLLHSRVSDYLQLRGRV